MAAYLLFFLFSTLLTAISAALILSLMGGLAAGLFIIPIAIFGAIVLFLPASFISAPVWVIITTIGRWLNWNEGATAKLASIPTLWVGVLAANSLSIDKGIQGMNVFETSSFVLFVMGIATLTGPIVAGKIYE